MQAVCQGAGAWRELEAFEEGAAAGAGAGLDGFAAGVADGPAPEGECDGGGEHDAGGGSEGVRAERADEAAAEEEPGEVDGRQQGPPDETLGELPGEATSPCEPKGLGGVEGVGRL